MVQVDKLIELVKKFPILYDVSHEEYTNIKKKDRIWDYIGLELQENRERLKKKFRNLGDKYSKYLMAKQMGQRVHKSKVNWQWAKQMEAFRPFINNIKESDLSGKEKTTPATLNPEINEFALRPPFINEINAPPLKKLHKRRPMEDSLFDVVVNNYLNKKRKLKVTIKPDPIECIFSGYANIVKRFSPKMQIIAKLEFAKLMSQLEFKHEEESNVSSESHNQTIENKNSFISENLLSQQTCEDLTMQTDEEEFIADVKPELISDINYNVNKNNIKESTKTLGDVKPLISSSEFVSLID